MQYQGYHFRKGRVRVRFLLPFTEAHCVRVYRNSTYTETSPVFVLPMWVYMREDRGREGEFRLFIESKHPNGVLSELLKTQQLFPELFDYELIIERYLEKGQKGLVTRILRNEQMTPFQFHVEQALLPSGFAFLSVVQKTLLERQTQRIALIEKLFSDVQIVQELSTQLDLTHS